MYETPDQLVAHDSSGKVPALGLGFEKTVLDPLIHECLLTHMKMNVHGFRSEPANDFLRTENARSYPSLLFQHEEFNQQLMSDLMAAHEEWSGRLLRKSACYGIRVYQPGSYLYNHIDHVQTHVLSSTICVDHRLTKPWPLYIEDLDGQPHEVSIEPGEMVFYEGARLIHGRPYPLHGEYYANIFVHYRPVDWDVDD